MKRSKIVIKGLGAVGERDYRGLLSFLLVLGWLALLWKGDYQAAGILSPAVGSAVAWYFARRKAD